MQIIETWLPLFPGFYETIFDANLEDEFYSMEQERDKSLPSLEYDDIGFNNEGYERDVVEQCTEFIEDILKSMQIVTSIKFQEVKHPREYNWYNDSGNVEIELSEENVLNIQKYIKENETPYREYLAQNYTSYDGFFSWYSAEVCDWYEYTNDFSDFSDKMHYLGSILEFICKNENIDEYMMYESLEIYLQDYYTDRRGQVKCDDCGEWYAYEEIEEFSEYNKMVKQQAELWKKTQKTKPPKPKCFEACYPDFKFLCNKCKPKTKEL